MNRSYFSSAIAVIALSASVAVAQDAGSSQDLYTDMDAGIGYYDPSDPANGGGARQMRVPNSLGDIGNITATRSVPGSDDAWDIELDVTGIQGVPVDPIFALLGSFQTFPTGNGDMEIRIGCLESIMSDTRYGMVYILEDDEAQAAAPHITFPPLRAGQTHRQLICDNGTFYLAHDIALLRD